MAIEALVKGEENRFTKRDLETAYWWAVRFESNVPDKSLDLQIYAYESKTARDAGAEPLTSLVIGIRRNRGQVIYDGEEIQIPAFDEIFADPQLAEELSAAIEVNGQSIMLTPAQAYNVLAQMTYRMFKRTFSRLGQGRDV